MMSERPPSLTPEEAREALALIEATTRKMRRVAAYGGMPYFLIIWGVVWFIGFAASHFVQPGPMVGWIWFVVDMLGFAATFSVAARLGRIMRFPLAATVGGFWLILVGYGVLFILFAQPRTDAQFSLLISLLVMFGYVVTGLLYRSPFLMGLGVLVTALMILGYISFPTLFNLWMAVMGGGSLMTAGVYILRTWR